MPHNHLLPIFLLLSSTLSAHARTPTHITAPAATLPLYPAFVHLPTPPAVLDATLLSMHAAPTGTGTNIFEWSVDCPTATNTANDSCRDLSIFPMGLWHTEHGAWEGRMTDRKEGVTTEWNCDLSAVKTMGPHCVDRFSSSEGEETTRTTMLGCHGDRGLVALSIGKGAEKLPEGWEGGIMAELNEAYGGGLEMEAGCAKTWTMQSGAPTVTGAKFGENAPTTTTTGGVGESGTRAAGVVVASETGEGAGERTGASGGLLVVGAAAAMWFGA